MKVIHWLKWVAISLLLLLFVPTGFESLTEFVHSLNKSDELALMDEDSTVLNNPNEFNRMYHIQIGGDLLTFSKLPGMESKIREVYDNYGIQLYFVEYVMDYNNLHATLNESIIEVTNYFKDNDLLDPYGMYYIVAEYDAPSFNSPEYDEDVYYWDTEIQGYVIYGDKVNKWWTTAVQREFERVAEKYDFRLNSYNNYEEYINVMSELRVQGNLTTVVPDSVETSYGLLAVFIIFSICPLGIAGIILHHDIKRYREKKRKQLEEAEVARFEETQRILNTPLKTLEEEQAESLLDKYND